MPNPIRQGAATIAAIAQVEPLETLLSKKKARAAIPTEEPAQYRAICTNDVKGSIYLLLSRVFHARKKRTAATALGINIKRV